MNVILSPKHEALVSRKVDSGQYESAEEVVADALELLQRRESERENSGLRPQAEAQQKPIWKVAQELMQDVPEKELEKLPTDGATEHDHYIYGTPKKYS